MLACDGCVRCACTPADWPYAFWWWAATIQAANCGSDLPRLHTSDISEQYLPSIAAYFVLAGPLTGLMLFACGQPQHKQLGLKITGTWTQKTQVWWRAYTRSSGLSGSNSESTQMK